VVSKWLVNGIRMVSHLFFECVGRACLPGGLQTDLLAGCCDTVVTLWLDCCNTVVVTLLLLHCCNTVVPLLFHC
jgi:hypothetical protein